MKKYTEMKKVAKGVTAAMTFAFAMLSVTTAYAAGTELAVVHDYVYKSTEVLTADLGVTEDEELEEIYVPASEDNSYSDVVFEKTEMGLIMPLLVENELASFKWEVTPGVRHVSEKISLKAGQKVIVACAATPSNVTYWIGIMNGNGDVRYVEVTAGMSRTFAIDKADSYRVLVQNRGSSTITAGISFYYYTP